jgi:hypothetical protein
MVLYMDAKIHTNIKKLLAAIDAGAPHRASGSTYDKAISMGLIEYAPLKTPGAGFAGPIQEPHWRRTALSFWGRP